ncbi:MAG: hypothetical protein O7H41_01295 [Planctomycetota bacterium]|nr:hypothetical protein [Planctomycetota bacterium]
MAGCTNAVDSRPANRSISGKPTAPVNITYTVPDKADVGKAIDAVVSFKVLQAVENLKLTLTEGKGLRIVSERTTFDYGARAAGASFSETISVRPEEEGILYLNVFVTGGYRGKVMTRTGAVPIKTGNKGTLDAPGRLTRDSEGRRLIEMPIPDQDR